MSDGIEVRFRSWVNFRVGPAAVINECTEEDYRRTVCAVQSHYIDPVAFWYPTPPAAPLPPRPVSLRGKRPGDPCPRCKAPLKLLAIDPYCVNDCDRPEPQAAAPTPIATEDTQPYPCPHDQGSYRGPYNLYFCNLCSCARP